MTTFTELLQRADAGDREAVDELWALIYDALRGMAARRVARLPACATLQGTALAHEVFLRLHGRHGYDWGGRRNFFRLAARAMHDIIVEQVRAHEAHKRGGHLERVPLDDQIAAPGPYLERLDVVQLLDRLRDADLDAHDAWVLRFGFQLTRVEIGDVLDVSEPTVGRMLRRAVAFLRRRTDGEDREDP